jgi:hypothetical protein
MNYLAIATLAAASCASPRVNGFFEHEIGSVRDPNTLVDLRALGETEACTGDRCDSANRDKSDGKLVGAYLTPAGRVAECILSVATYQSPTPDELTLHLSTYAAFSRDLRDRDIKGCDVCTGTSDWSWPAPLLPLHTKYLARCSVETKDALVHVLEAELSADVAAARSERGYDSHSFGDKLTYCELKLAWIEELGGDPGLVARGHVDLGELRYGVYGPTAMRAAFEHDPAVAPAREEIDRIERDMRALTQNTKPTEIDQARQLELQRRSDELHTAIATEQAKYSFAASDARVKAYETEPETVQIKQRLSVLKAELGEVREIGRADAIAAELKQLEAQLVMLRKQYGISWSIF